MYFPECVERHKTKAARAQARLRYILMQLALRVGRDSLRGLASYVGVEHSTISKAIKKGQCSDALAIRIETKFTRDVIRHEHLRDPLTIEATQQ